MEGIIQVMANITLVYGPPCAGKSTYAKRIKSDNTILIERDTLHSAMTGMPNHVHTKNGMKLANAGYKAMLETAKKMNGQYIFVAGAPTKLQRQPFIEADAKIQLVYTDKQTCMTRARAERPLEWQTYIENWFERYENDQNITTGVLL